MIPQKHIKPISIVSRIVGVLCICYWASIVLYSRKAFERFPEAADAVSTISLLGFEFSQEQLQSAFTILLLPIGVFLWVFADYQSRKVDN
jgi:hypothetical protein